MAPEASRSGDSELTQASEVEASATVVRDRLAAAHPGAPSVGRTIGRYVISKQVGAGAMGLVFRAFDPKLERYVALKLLAPGSTKSPDLSRERLLREARGLARIEHPNVVTVHDVGVADNRVFIAMEFVDGGDLKQWMRKASGGQPRAWREVIDRFIAAGEGLAAAHAAGLVHRDFKPANVLLRSNGRVLVSDFGLVREAASDDTTAPTISDAPQRPPSNLTVTGTVLGTPAYMAPEQFVGHPADERSDQFSFCVAAWEALSGRRPFWPYLTSQLYTQATDDPPALPDDAVPRRAYRALRRGLSRHPEDRYASMEDLLVELRAIPRPRPFPARWVFLAVLLVAALGGLAFSLRPPSPPEPPTNAAEIVQEPVAVPEPPTVEPPPVDPRARVQEIDAEVGMYEKTDRIGAEMADLQLRRALAHLSAFESGGPIRHVQVAHELLLRVRDNVWRHPDPQVPAAVALAELSQLQARADLMERAGITLEPLSRFALAVLQRHGDGAQVRSMFAETEDNLVCIEPCTWAVRIGDGGFVRVEYKGQEVGNIGWNPRQPLGSPAHF